MIEISNTIISPIGTILSNRDRVEIIKGDGNNAKRSFYAIR